MIINNLEIIGTSHIAKESSEKIKKTIEEKKPEIVAIELDKKRYLSLTSKEKKKSKIKLSDIRRIGVKGFLFSIFGGWIQKKLGKFVGVDPGIDMLTAIKFAQKNHAKIALIDQDIEITLKKLSKYLTWKEKFRFLMDIIKAFIFRKSEMKKWGINSIDLRKVPPETLIKKMIDNVKIRYPNFYKVLVEERNHIMAFRLKSLMNKYPDKQILAIIGAGHKEGIVEIIKSKKDSIILQENKDL